MRQAVRDTFFDFTVGHEGFTPFPYCDTLNLVTTGVGNLIDAGIRNGFDISATAMAPAMRLPWKFRGPGWTSKNPIAAGACSAADIREAWIRCKLQEQQVPGFNQKGGFAYASLTPITLDMQGIKDLFNSTLSNFESTLAARYSGFQTWPADAQLALLSMAWAMGPGFNFPAFKSAVDKLDFNSAATQSFFKGGGGTLEAPGGDPLKSRAGRNRENFIMFTNAANVLKGGADPDRLFFPNPVSTAPAAINVTPALAAATGAAEKIALIGGGIGAVGLLGWEAFKWYDGRRGKR